MDLVTHTSSLPWLIDQNGLLTIGRSLLGALAFMLVAGLLYGVLYRLLSNRSGERTLFLEDYRPAGRREIANPQTAISQTHGECSSHET